MPVKKTSIAKDKLKVRNLYFKLLKDNALLVATIFNIFVVGCFIYVLGVFITESNETQKDLQELKDEYKFNTVVRMKQEAKNE